MDEIHSLDGDEGVASRADGLKRLIRWDPDLASLLDELKDEQKRTVNLSFNKRKAAEGGADEGACKSPPYFPVRQTVQSLSSRLSGTAAMGWGGRSGGRDTAELSRPRRFVLAPPSLETVTMGWLVNIAIWYTLISLPLLAFVVSGSDTSLVLNILCDVTFGVDLVLNFFVAYSDPLLGIQATPQEPDPPTHRQTPSPSTPPYPGAFSSAHRA